MNSKFKFTFEFTSAFKITINLILLLTMSFTISGCKNPLEGFYKYVQNDGYLPYRFPLAKAGPGTLISGTPANPLVMIPSGSSKCFPKVEEALASGLIVDNPAALPSITHSMDLKAYTNFSLAQEGLDISAGAEFGLAKSVSMYTINPSVVTFDFSALREHYASISEECKNDLKNKHLVIEALKVEKVHFIFKDNKNSSFYAKMVLEKLINVGAGYDLSIMNEVELTVNTPMFIGLRLGKLDANGRVIAISNSIKKKNWYYTSIDKLKNSIFNTDIGTDTDTSALNGNSDVADNDNDNNVVGNDDDVNDINDTNDDGENNLDKAEGIVGGTSIRLIQ
ncbi:MAG: hypothetical protein HQK51_00870 [Oligoflexia bacterium]|nr:hypothetical protein [Oligoflexia bacterium]